MAKPPPPLLGHRPSVSSDWRGYTAIGLIVVVFGILVASTVTLPILAVCRL